MVHGRDARAPQPVVLVQFEESGYLLLGTRAPRPPEPKTMLLKCQVKSYETKSSRCALSAGEGARAPSKAEPRFRIEAIPNAASLWTLIPLRTTIGINLTRKAGERSFICTQS